MKALAEASKNGYLYILNRETGQPVHSIKGDAGPDRGGASRRIRLADAADSVHRQRKADAARCRRCFPTDIPADRLANNKLVPHFTPPGPNMIYAPGTGGGANYGPLSYSPRTGLLYVNAIDEPAQLGQAGARLPVGVRSDDR